MMSELDEHTKADTAGKGQPRFGSYLGLFFVAAILGILSFALFHDSGIGHAFAGLKPGMTPTEVAAVLGVPRSETRSGPSLRSNLADARRCHLQGQVPGRKADRERA